MVAYGKKNFASAGEEELLCPSIVYGNIVEVLPDQLYWAMTTTSDGIEAKSNLAIYVSFADKYHYEPFYQDFGPWNLSVLYRLCKLIDNVVTRERRHKRKIVMYCSSDNDDEIEKLRANCAYVMAGYLMIFHGLSADAAYLRIEPAQPPPFVGFRDAAMGEPTYLLHLHDVLRGIEQAQRHKWLDFNTFDADEYEYYEKVENGDFNWIIPGKVLSFCGPHNESKVEDGYPYHSPETYFDYFRDNNLTTIIRLNTKIYDARKFTNAGFDHVDLFFIDGSVPSDDIVERFIDVVDTSKGAVAVHCKAGLGRTGTLIACWMMKKYGLSAAECIAWLRICRPGSVIGPQQGFLVDKQKFCWSMSERNVVHHPNNKRRGSSKEKKSSLKKLMNKVDEMKVSWKNANNNDKSEKEKSSSKHEENEVLNNGNSNVGNANPEVISDETYVDSEGRSQGDRLLALKAKSQHQNMNNMSQNQNQNQNHSDVNPRSSNSAGTNGINGDRNTRSSRMSPNYSPPANYQHQSLRSSQKPNHQNNAHRPRRHIHLSPLRHENHDANRTQGTDILRFNNAMILEPSSTVYPMVSRYGSREPTRYSSPTTPIKQPLPTGYMSRVDKYRLQLQLSPIESSPPSDRGWRFSTFKSDYPHLPHHVHTTHRHRAIQGTPIEIPIRVETTDGRGFATLPIARVTVRSESQTRQSSNLPQSKSTSAIRKMNPSGSKVSSSRSRPYPPPTSGIRMEMAATNYDLRSKSGAGKSSPGREAASQLPPDTKALIGQRRSKRLSS